MQSLVYDREATFRQPFIRRLGNVLCRGGFVLRGDLARDFLAGVFEDVRVVCAEAADCILVAGQMFWRNGSLRKVHVDS